MNSAHDLGGMHGFDPIGIDEIEASRPVAETGPEICEGAWPEKWEETVFSMTLACGMLGQWNLDQSRFARENMEPGHYLNSSYYEHWLHGLETLLLERGLVSQDELKDGRCRQVSSLKAVTKEDVTPMLRKGGPTLLPSESGPVFDLGDRVMVENFHPKSHTRAPRYIRGRRGLVVGYHGAHVFPDTSASSGEKVPAHLYNVRFEPGELWGEQAADNSSSVFVDVFEPYLKLDGLS